VTPIRHCLRITGSYSWVGPRPQTRIISMLEETVHINSSWPDEAVSHTSRLKTPTILRHYYTRITSRQPLNTTQYFRQTTQPFILTGSINRVPTCPVGVKAGYGIVGFNIPLDKRRGGHLCRVAYNTVWSNWQVASRSSEVNSRIHLRIRSFTFTFIPLGHTIHFCTWWLFQSFFSEF